MTDLNLALALDGAAFDADPAPSWLEQSWRNPLGFETALFRHAAAMGARAADSVPGQGYDLYGGLVARNIGQGRVALRWYERGGKHGELSYDALHARAGALARQWSRAGVVPGAMVAVVLPFGAECAIALLTGLRVGACVSFVPPLGDQFVVRRLTALAPPFLASDPMYYPMLAGYKGLTDATLLALGPASEDARDAVTSGMAGGVIDERSYRYQPAEPCACLFSPLRAPTDVALPVPAAAAYRGALRDGSMVFALRPGDEMAAPGSHVWQHQPSLLFAALIAGATYVHIPMDVARSEPHRLRDMLFDRRLRAVGVSAALRDLLIEVQHDAKLDKQPDWDFWFRNPAEPVDWTAWCTLIDRYHLERIPAGNIVAEAASGGAVLISPRRLGKAQQWYFMNVLPAPGEPWMLLDVSQSGQGAAGDAGLFARTGSDPPSGPGPILLARSRGHEYMYAGNPEPRRAGRVYPYGEVLEACAKLAFVRGASFMPALSGGVAVEYRFLLLVFTGPSPEPDDEAGAGEAERRTELDRVIAGQVGEEFLPDRYEFFPLYPRRGKAGAIDHGWCREQYVTGALYRKAHSPLFSRLTALRQACQPRDPETPLRAPP